MSLLLGDRWVGWSLYELTTYLADVEINYPNIFTGHVHVSLACRDLQSVFMCSLDTWLSTLVKVKA